MIRKEAWSFYRTISGVRLSWELEEPKGPRARPARASGTLGGGTGTQPPGRATPLAREPALRFRGQVLGLTRLAKPGQAFSQSDQIVRTHTGDRPYSCATCDHAVSPESGRALGPLGPLIFFFRSFRQSQVRHRVPFGTQHDNFGQEE